MPTTPARGSAYVPAPSILLRDNRRGYVRCSLTRDAWTSEFRLVKTKTRGLPGSTLATAVIENGRAGAEVSLT